MNELFVIRNLLFTRLDRSSFLIYAALKYLPALVKFRNIIGFLLEDRLNSLRLEISYLQD